MKQIITRIPWQKGNMETWGAQRKNMEGIGEDWVRVGASDVSVITGTNKWKEKRRLFQHLVGDYSSFILTETTIAGHLMEPITASRWESWDEDEYTAFLQTHNNIKVRKLKQAKFFVLNSAYPNFFISLDYICKGKQHSPFTGELYVPLTPHELKHTNSDYYHLWENGITKAYYDQIQTQMLITNTQVAVFHVLIDGVKYKVKEFARDEERIAEIVAEVDAFCELVKDGKEAFFQSKNAPTQELRDRFAAIYEEMLPEFNGMKDGIALADELWKAPIDSDVSFKKGNVKEDNMMAEYWDYLRLEETIKTEKNKIAATLKTRASGFEGIKTTNYKLINRGNNGAKGKYFSIKPIKEKGE